MAYVTNAEYQAAKNEIIGGVEFNEETQYPNQWGMSSKQYATIENGTFYEVTDPNTSVTEFWSDKHPASRYYDGRTREELIAQYEAKLAAANDRAERAARENETLKARVKAMRKPTGTNMQQADYEKLEKCGGELTDAEAIVLVNKEFGFEAARIEILHELEVDITPEGSRYVKIEKRPCKALYEATDWNYIRFNVHTSATTWYFEMINADLNTVLL